MTDVPFSRAGTSEDAADDMRESAASIREKILRLAIQRAYHGLTCWEAEIALSLSENTCHPRFWELATLSQSKSARRTRLTVPRALFVIDQSVVAKGKEITRKNPKSRKKQLVYFAFAVVSIEDVLVKYGLQDKPALVSYENLFGFPVT